MLVNSLECLKLLIEKLGADCLTWRNARNETAVHLAAKYHDDSWMELIRDTLGKDCFTEVADSKRTAVHYAAINKSNATLKWLAKECGTDCLTFPDENGNTAIHLAAEYQTADSLKFLHDQLGPQILTLMNHAGDTLPYCVAMDPNIPRRSEKSNWIASQPKPKADCSGPIDYICSDNRYNSVIIVGNHRYVLNGRDYKTNPRYENANTRSFKD